MADEPVRACPPSVGYKLRKFAVRHRGKMVVAGAMAAMLIAATSVSIGFALRASRALTNERNEHARAERALTEREEQRKLAEKSEVETGRVAELQSLLHADIRVDAMGRGI